MAKELPHKHTLVVAPNTGGIYCTDRNCDLYLGSVQEVIVYIMKLEALLAVHRRENRRNHQFRNYVIEMMETLELKESIEGIMAASNQERLPFKDETEKQEEATVGASERLHKHDFADVT
jgi:UDP-N-acetylglucosamine 2-epimerase